MNAECVNYPGNYTCLCKDGFAGDPYNGCGDIDECTQPGACGPGAICTNLEGGFRCDCPAGFNGDARSAQGCADYDECTRSPCGRNALCRNDVGSFRCECPEGFHGDPMTDCQGNYSASDRYSSLYMFNCLLVINLGIRMNQLLRSAISNTVGVFGQQAVFRIIAFNLIYNHLRQQSLKSCFFIPESTNYHRTPFCGCHYHHPKIDTHA